MLFFKQWPVSYNTPYEKIGDEVRSLADEVPFDIPDSWEWVRLGNISSYAETKQKVNATSADPSIWGLDLEDIEKGGRLLEYKTVGCSPQPSVSWFSYWCSRAAGANARRISS